MSILKVLTDCFCYIYKVDKVLKKAQGLYEDLLCQENYRLPFYNFTAHEKAHSEVLVWNTKY